MIFFFAEFSKFRYATGKTYSYKYEVDVASVVDGVSGAQESRIHLTAKVHFDVNTLCDWTLRVCFIFYIYQRSSCLSFFLQKTFGTSWILLTQYCDLEDSQGIMTSLQ